MPDMNNDDPYFGQFLKTKAGRSRPIPKVDPLPVVTTEVLDDFHDFVQQSGGDFVQDVLIPIGSSVIVLALMISCVLWAAPILINR